MKVEKEKAVQVLLYIVGNLDSADFHKIFKVLYFAEQSHLVKYGSPILGDTFIKMEHGPVPSLVRDFFTRDKLSDFFDIDEYIVTSKHNPNLDEFAETELECLKESLQENKDLTFGELKRKSHKAAWNSAYMNSEIPYREIAKEGGADEELLKYLDSYLENAKVLA